MALDLRETWELLVRQGPKDLPDSLGRLVFKAALDLRDLKEKLGLLEFRDPRGLKDHRVLLGRRVSRV